jgi:hypothetical protein
MTTHASPPFPRFAVLCPILALGAVSPAIAGHPSDNRHSPGAQNSLELSAEQLDKVTAGEIMTSVEAGALASGSYSSTSTTTATLALSSTTGTMQYGSGLGSATAFGDVSANTSVSTQVYIDGSLTSIFGKNSTYEGSGYSFSQGYTSALSLE